MCCSASSTRMRTKPPASCSHVHQHGVGECGVFTYEVRRDQGDAGDDFARKQPASPAVRHGKNERLTECRPSHATSSRPSTGPWRSPTTPSRVRDARAPAAGADRRSGCGGGDARLQRRPGRPAPEPDRLRGQRAVEPRHRRHDDSKPTRRVPARHPARRHPRSSRAGREEVTGANVLVAIFAERESHAAYFLQEQDMTRYDAVNLHFARHRQARRKCPSRARRGGAEEGAGRAQFRHVRGRGCRRPATARRRARRWRHTASTSTSGPRRPHRQERRRSDSVIGREPEVQRTIQVLCRRQKNNPLLVGEPGVGKTAIAEGLARKIITGEVPDVLADATVFALDMGTLLAGTRYRGDFEESPQAGDERRSRRTPRRSCSSTRSTPSLVRARHRAAPWTPRTC